jgi:hypothetical protein
MQMMKAEIETMLQTMEELSLVMGAIFEQLHLGCNYHLLLYDK